MVSVSGFDINIWFLWNNNIYFNFYHPSTPFHPTYTLPPHLHPATLPTFSGLHKNIHNNDFNLCHPPSPFHPHYTLPIHRRPATPPTFSGLLKKIHPTYNLPPHLYPATPPIPHHTPYTLPSQLYPATSHIPRHPTFTLPPTALESALLVYLSTYDRVSTFSPEEIHISDKMSDKKKKNSS